MPTSDRFTEQHLLADVCATWGEFGAHADLTRWMIAEVRRLTDALAAARTGAALLRCEQLESAGDALHDAVRNHDLTEAHLRAWVEARCRNGSADGAETVVQGLRCG